MADTIWWIDKGQGPLVATAIHDGHDVRPAVLYAGVGNALAAAVPGVLEELERL